VSAPGHKRAECNTCGERHVTDLVPMHTDKSGALTYVGQCDWCCQVAKDLTESTSSFNPDEFVCGNCASGQEQVGDW
jgi:hypothetical protein